VQEIGGQHDVLINWMLPPEPVSPQGFSGVCDMVEPVRECLVQHKIGVTGLCTQVWNHAVKIAKKDSLLSADQIAPIVMYTQDDFFLVLNGRMREATRMKAQARKELKIAWGFYIRCLLTSLRLLPSYKGELFRCIPSKLSEIKKHYTPDTVVRWNSFTSCTFSAGAAWQLVRPHTEPVFFAIQVKDGKEIARYSAFPNEREVLLEPNAFFRVLHISRRRIAKVLLQVYPHYIFL